MKTKKEMIEFILSFVLYPTMNSWNQAYGFSYNVKVNSLPLSSKEKDAVYGMLDADGFYDDINRIVRDWEMDMIEKYNYTGEKYYEGAGWINTEDKRYKARIKEILAMSLTAKCRKEYEEALKNKTSIYGAIRTIEKQGIFEADFNGRSGGHLVLYKWNGHNYCGEGWNYDKDELEEMLRDDVKYVYVILKEFEKLYKSLLSQVKYLAKNYKVEEDEYQVTKTRNVLVEA